MPLSRRIGGFLRWIVRTPWPLFTLSMLQADLIGVTQAPPREAIAVHSQRVVELLLDLFGTKR